MNAFYHRPSYRAILSLALVIVLALALAPGGYAVDDDETNPPIVVPGLTGTYVPPTPTPPPVATDLDLIVDDMPISSDETPGYILVNLPLKYKMTPVNHYSYQVQYLEVYPVFEKPDESPFDLDSSQLTRSLMELQTTEVNGRTVTYMTFPFRVKKTTASGYYPIKFHARYMHQGGSMLYDKPTETDLTINVLIEHGATPTPTPTPTPGPAGPQSVPKIIIDTFKTDPEIIMTGDEFDLTLSLFNTSKKRDVSNIKCTIDGGEVIVPVSGSNTFYIEDIGKEKSYEYKLRMSAQPLPASSTSAAVGKSQHTVKVKMEYEYKADQLETATVEETFTLRVRQEVKVDLNTPRVDPMDVSDGDYFDVSMSLINKGKATIYNLTARYEGPSMFVPDDVYFGGLCNPGESKTVTISCSVMGSGSGGGGGMMFPGGGVMIRGVGSSNASDGVFMSATLDAGALKDAAGEPKEGGTIPAEGEQGMPDGEGFEPAPNLSGPQQCKLIITYEDEYGNETREEVPFTVNYTAPEVDMDPTMNGMGMDAFNQDGMSANPPVQGGMPGWLLWGIIGLVVVVGVVVTVILVRRKRRPARRMGGNAVE